MPKIAPLLKMTRSLLFYVRNHAGLASIACRPCLRADPGLDVGGGVEGAGGAGSDPGGARHGGPQLERLQAEGMPHNELHHQNTACMLATDCVEKRISLRSPSSLASGGNLAGLRRRESWLLLLIICCCCWLSCQSYNVQHLRSRLRRPRSVPVCKCLLCVPVTTSPTRCRKLSHGVIGTVAVSSCL